MLDAGTLDSGTNRTIATGTLGDDISIGGVRCHSMGGVNKFLPVASPELQG